MPKTETILTLEQLSTGYKERGKTSRVSTKLNLSIKNGHLVALLGPNGVGKSTLLRTIAGLQPPLSGSVSIKNKTMEHLSGKEKALLLSLVLTDKIDAAHLKVQDLVAVGRYPHTGYLGILSEKDRSIIQQMLTKCHLDGFQHRYYTTLSDGEKQRVMLARALTQETPLMMLDEPTAHLDLPNRIQLMQMLRDLAQQTNKAILLSTHELDLALQWCDTLWLMDDNGNITDGTPEDLVLAGVFSKIFANETYYFDLESGTFKLNRHPIAEVILHGKGATYEWTKRALEREQFEVTNSNSSNIVIEITENNSWILTIKTNSQAFSSLSELLTCLRKIHTA